MAKNTIADRKGQTPCAPYRRFLSNRAILPTLCSTTTDPNSPSSASLYAKDNRVFSRLPAAVGLCIRTTDPRATRSHYDVGTVARPQQHTVVSPTPATCKEMSWCAGPLLSRCFKPARHYREGKGCYGGTRVESGEGFVKSRLPRAHAHEKITVLRADTTGNHNQQHPMICAQAVRSPRQVSPPGLCERSFSLTCCYPIFRRPADRQILIRLAGVHISFVHVKDTPR